MEIQDYKQFDNKLDMLTHAFLNTETLEQYQNEVASIEKLFEEQL